MSFTPTPQALAEAIAAERRRDAVMAESHARHEEQFRGVGDIIPEAFVGRSEEQLARAALAVLAERAAFQASDEGRCLAELRELEDLADERGDREAFELIDMARSARSRNYIGERQRIEALIGLAREKLGLSPSPVSAREVRAA